ncbi:MAG: penicillin acylase family protein [Bryobacteraceae bacterium]
MTLARLLKVVNGIIAVLLVALVVAAYWYAWRPLSRTSGQLAAPVSARAVVSWDGLGVPHVLGATLPDVFFVQGYVTAQDRFFQMDAMRRRAAGELSDVVGAAALESDRLMRRLRLARIAGEYARRLPAADRAVLAAYARGVNHFLESHRGRLPLEFSLLRYDPRPWFVTDSLLVCLTMVETLESSWRRELRKENLLANGDAAKVNFLLPPHLDGETLPGSNAWAVSGAHTASRRPLLAGDPHLELGMPSIWHMVHLRGPRLNVTGVTVPGLPGVLIGHNDRIAWSITSLEFDVQDLYVEKLDPASGRYEFSGRVEQARPERELIRVRGAPTETILTWVTRHGPVVITEGGRSLSLRWTAADPAGAQFPILDLNRAVNWDGFRAALSRLPGPAVNFVYADAAGNIGYQAAGRLPVRKDFDGSVPVDGSEGKSEWDGYMPFERLPSVFNPPSGMIVSANQNPFPADFPYRVSGYFASPYRYRQIRDRLQAGREWKAEDMRSLQMDVYSGFSHFLAREIVAAHSRRRTSYPGLDEAVELLGKWDGCMSASSPAPMIATLSYLHLRAALARRASKAAQPVYSIPAAPAVIERLLRERPKDWFDDFDKFLLDNVSEAIAEGRRMQGRDVSRWDYGRYNSIVLDNPVIGRLPVLGKYFNLGRVPMSGSSETILQKPQGMAFGPSMRMVVDFAGLDQSTQNITLGQSGQVLSRHYKDQWEAWQAGRSFPMQFNKIDAKATLTFVPPPR